MRSTAVVSIAVAAAFMLGPVPVIAGERVYVPLGGADAVVVIDVEQDTVIGRIEGLPAAHGLAGTPDGRFLIAGSYEERAAAGAAPDRPAAVSADAHAAHHGGAGAAANPAGAMVSTVSVVETTGRSVIRRIDVPGAVHHVAVSPDGGVAVVSHPNEGAISAIDLKTYAVIATVPTGPLTNYATFSPAGDEVYVSNAGNDTVSAVDTKRWIVRWNVVVGASPEHIVRSGDGATLYVNNVDDGAVSVIDVAARKVVKTIPAGTTLHGVDLSDDGGVLFVAALGDDSITRIDLVTGATRQARLTPAPYHLLAVRGLNKLYVSSADEPKIWIVDQSDLSVRGEIAIGGTGHQMVLAPGG